MKRGDLVIISAPADYGKPRPAVIIQSDWLQATESVLVALVTGAAIDAPIYRLQLQPTATNGLRAPSQVMVDKIVALPRGKCGAVIGSLNAKERVALNNMLSVTIGLAD